MSYHHPSHHWNLRPSLLLLAASKQACPIHHWLWQPVLKVQDFPIRHLRLLVLVHPNRRWQRRLLVPVHPNRH
jgi:hypothetical protein